MSKRNNGKQSHISDVIIFSTVSARTNVENNGWVSSTAARVKHVYTNMIASRKYHIGGQVKYLFSLCLDKNFSPSAGIFM